MKSLLAPFGFLCALILPIWGANLFHKETQPPPPPPTAPQPPTFPPASNTTRRPTTKGVPFGGQALTCPRGKAMSIVWYQDNPEDKRKYYAMQCANVTQNCDEKCEWAPSCDLKIYGPNCYARGLQMIYGTKDTDKKVLYLCCKGTAEICASAAGDGQNQTSTQRRLKRSIGRHARDTEVTGDSEAPPEECPKVKIPCKLQVHAVKEAIPVNPALAQEAGLDGLSDLNGISIVSEAPLSLKDLLKTKPCKQNKCSEEEAKKAYSQFADKFPGRELYGEQVSRKQFSDNLDSVTGLKTECTLGPADADFDLGKFGDLTLDQMVKLLGGSLAEGGQKEYTINKRYLKTWQKYKSLDWRDFKVVPAVRYQGICGSCYAFTSSELLAIQGNIDRKIQIPANGSAYAAQFILDCFQRPQALHCTGGRPHGVLKYLTECGDECALPLESCYKYIGNETILTCQKTKCKETKTGRAKWTEFLRITQNEKETMAMLLRWGPLLATIEITPAIQFYKSGVVRSYQCGRNTNHAIVIVGYNYDTEVPYYIVKNSWGPDYGQKGYVYIEAGKNACGIANGVVTICVDDQCEKIRSVEDIIKRPHAPKKGWD